MSPHWTIERRWEPGFPRILLEVWPESRLTEFGASRIRRITLMYYDVIYEVRIVNPLSQRYPTSKKS